MVPLEKHAIFDYQRVCWHLSTAIALVLDDVIIYESCCLDSSLLASPGFKAEALRKPWGISSNPPDDTCWSLFSFDSTRFYHHFFFHFCWWYLHIFRTILKYCYINWLVVWNMTFIFPLILGMSSSQLTNSYFSEGFKPPTSKSCQFHSSTSVSTCFFLPPQPPEPQHGEAPELCTDLGGGSGGARKAGNGGDIPKREIYIYILYI